ncbi:MAG: glycoside hydrolase family 43 protein [Bacteroidales bacterium]|nr:glycoside hydrolase family 43 protein [Bacteroidales bacterium]
MKKIIFYLLTTILGFSVQGQMVRHNVPLDSIILSDPAILADEATRLYYMTGTGGKLWRSSDLKVWEGPYDVAQPDTASWMGAHPAIWAAELHKYNGKYYYFATFTNPDIIIDHQNGEDIPRRASHVLVSDNPMGPYRPVGPDNYLPADKPTLDGTFWVEPDGTPYMVYCWEWLQQLDGTIEAIQLRPDLSGTVGEAELLFRASDAPWNNDDARGAASTGKQSEVTDGPFLFRTDTGRLGMIWTSWKGDIYCQGVAYSESGTIHGPWHQEPELITPLNFGHGMLFRDFDGQWRMSVHSHSDINGHYRRIPHIFPADLSTDTLKIQVAA